MYGNAFICACTHAEFTCACMLMLHHSECLYIAGISFFTLKLIHYFIASLSRKISTQECQGLQFTHACAHVC